MRTVRTWDLAVGLFHGLPVAAFAPAFRSSEEDSVLSGWHVHASLGHKWRGSIAVVGWLGLTAATVVTGIVGGERYHEVIARTLPAMIALHVGGSSRCHS